jgi:sugar lactone lactonase YvrE
MVVYGYSSGETLTQPRGVAFDPRTGALYVANTGAHRIEVFSRSGRPLHRFVHRVILASGSVADGAPCALAFDRSGRLLVVDNAVGYVDVLTRRGRPVTRFDVPGGRPSALLVARDGTIHVGTTAEASRVHRFTAGYRPLGSWGEPGEEPGRLHWVTALAELRDGAIAVACARTQLGIQVFTAAGAYQRGFATHEMGEGNLSLPSGLVCDADGCLWVADEIRNMLQVFDGGGRLIAKTGGQGAAPGQLSNPSALAFDGRGLLAVTDREIGRVQVFGIQASDVALGEP